MRILKISKKLHQSIVDSMCVYRERYIEKEVEMGISTSEQAVKVLEKLDAQLESIDCDLHEEVDDADEVLNDIACDIPDIRAALRIVFEVLGDA